MTGDFGLRVVLNSLDRDNINGMDTRRIDTRASQKRLMASTSSHLGDFDFELDEDLISLVSGVPRDGALARKLTGADSLSVTGDYTLPALGRSVASYWRLLTVLNIANISGSLTSLG